ncbi:hypothetical protein HPB50_027636 [Hyalomma asiaticum]|nr:hypothetical protein HPB50_027636 [Hyalomma asiaticum]
MIGAADFTPTFVVIATWRNVTLTGMQSKSNVTTNTYQVVLASDERRTRSDWIAVNDVNNGENGENPFVGFNAGNTTRYYEFIPYSQEPRVKNLPQHGEGNGIKGRYIFEIEEEIWHGSCIKWEPPELAAEDIEILDDNDKAERPERMRIKWNPNKLVNNNNTNVQLHLWGYNDDLEYPQLTYIDTLASGMRNGERCATR